MSKNTAYLKSLFYQDPGCKKWRCILCRNVAWFSSKPNFVPRMARRHVKDCEFSNPRLVDRFCQMRRTVRYNNYTAQQNLISEAERVTVDNETEEVAAAGNNAGEDMQVAIDREEGGERVTVDNETVEDAAAGNNAGEDMQVAIDREEGSAAHEVGLLSGNDAEEDAAVNDAEEDAAVNDAEEDAAVSLLLVANSGNENNNEEHVEDYVYDGTESRMSDGYESDWRDVVNRPVIPASSLAQLIANHIIMGGSSHSLLGKSIVDSNPEEVEEDNPFFRYMISGVDVNFFLEKIKDVNMLAIPKQRWIPNPRGLVRGSLATEFARETKWNKQYRKLVEFHVSIVFEHILIKTQ